MPNYAVYDTPVIAVAFSVHLDEISCQITSFQY